MMAEDGTPLVEALAAIIEAARTYLPGEMIKDEFVITGDLTLPGKLG
jgi:hypothetical protein